ncbi:MAG: peptide-methionine (S)-S-oxide reductase MsrA [Bernardetiaceae bacterium]
MYGQTFFLIFLLSLSFSACGQSTSTSPETSSTMQNQTINENWEIATLGGGCFWCVEAVYQRIEGIEKIVSGYTGGHVPNPTYKAICTGTTGHAEVVQVYFDPAKITYAEVLDVFWHAHDPTTLNRQGNDVGTQYRSAIFYHNDAQKAAALQSKAETEAAKLWKDPIVTEITPLDVFYPAEDYHQNYYNQNKSSNPYCVYVISPKVQKIKQKFSERLKKE